MGLMILYIEGYSNDVAKGKAAQIQLSLGSTQKANDIKEIWAGRKMLKKLKIIQ